MKRLYYLQRSKAISRFVSGELWETELETGKRQRLLPDFLMEHYDVSPDGRQVIFITAEGSGRAPLWVGAIDGSSSPRRLSDQDCIRALFAPDGDILFVGGHPGDMFLQSIKADGTGLRRIIPDRAVFLYAISPDGKWVAAWVGADVNLYSSAGGKAIRVCTGCASGGAENRGVTPPLINWSRDEKALYLFSERTFHTYSIPLQHGQILPPLPADGLQLSSVEKSLSDAHMIAQDRDRACETLPELDTPVGRPRRRARVLHRWDPGLRLRSAIELSLLARGEVVLEYRNRSDRQRGLPSTLGRRL